MNKVRMRIGVSGRAIFLNYKFTIVAKTVTQDTFTRYQAQLAEIGITEGLNVGQPGISGKVFVTSEAVV